MEEKREEGRKDGGDKEGRSYLLCDARTPGGPDVSRCLRP